MQEKQTNAREAYKPAFSSSSEMITMLHGTEKPIRTKNKVSLNKKRIVVKTTKPHKIRTTPGTPP